MESVGLQLWAGALVLSEFIMANEQHFANSAVLELGAGLALPSLCAARAGARRVFATDYADTVLANCADNLALNAAFLRGAAPPAVRRLDWFQPAELLAPPAEAASGPWCWSRKDRDAISGDVVILAADVVYDEVLTDALVGVLSRLLRRNSVLYLSIERRINFTLEDMAPTAKQYDNFFKHVHCVDAHPRPSAPLRGMRLPLESVTQRFQYERTPQLELWRLQSNVSTHPM